MRSKGFTLIELLAVIVILAIIALIATPIILNIINDSKVESKKRSAENYFDAVELAIANKNLEGKFNPRKCTIEEKTKKLTCEGEFDTVHCKGETSCTTADLEVKVDGEVPTEVIIEFSDGTVANGTTVTIGGTSFVKESSGLKVQLNNSISSYKKYENGEVVYFDVINGEGCLDTDYLPDNSLNGYNGLNGTATQNSCLKFYAFLDDGGSNLNLLLDHNTSSIGSPNLKNQLLNNDTKNWSDKIITQRKYQTHIDGELKEVDYTGYKARYIAAQEVAQIVGVDWNENSGFFNEGEVFNLKNISWLYDNISIQNCDQYGCYGNSTRGYFTVNSLYSYQGLLCVTNNSLVAEQDHVGMLYFVGDNYGIRPVIEVSKFDL